MKKARQMEQGFIFTAGTKCWDHWVSLEKKIRFGNRRKKEGITSVNSPRQMTHSGSLE
jgi:hypothetical protein